MKDRIKFHFLWFSTSFCFKMFKFTPPSSLNIPTFEICKLFKYLRKSFINHIILLLSKDNNGN